jgi:hypothetical protein
MVPSNEILTELQEIAPLLGRDGIFRVPYTVPAGYFEDFIKNLMNRIQLERGVFSGSQAGQEIAEISPLEEITGISPLLAGLQNKNPYQVPEGYFDSWKAKIPDSIPSKVVTIPSIAAQTNSSAFDKNRVFNFPRMMKVAVAACIIALLGTTMFNLTYHRNVADPLMGLASVSDQDMANFLDSDDIHWTPGIASATEIASVVLNDNDINDLLSSVPDVELEQYSALLPEEKPTVN